jgi:hypothetical protein
MIALEKSIEKKIAEAYTLKTKSVEAIANCEKKIYEYLLQSKQFTADEKA